MNIVALDLSLTETGYATSAGATGVLEPPHSVGLRIRRLQWIRFSVMGLALNADLVVIEGYSYGSEHQAHQMGELGGVVRVALRDRNIRYVDVAPTSLKKFATGKGTTKKIEVFGEAIRQLGYTGNNHNVADALWLRRMAAAQYQVAGVKATNQKQRDALEVIEWPLITTHQPEPVTA